MLDTKKIVNTGLVVILFIVIIFYALNRTDALQKGVELKLSNLEDGQSLENLTYTIEGNASRARELKVNGIEIIIDDEGNFSHKMIFSPGFNTVDIIALDKFGKESRIYREIYAVEEKFIPDQKEPEIVEEIIEEELIDENLETNQI